MKVTMIYLAAGNSRRFGSNKLLYKLDGKKMYRHLLERLTAIAAAHPDWEVVTVSQYPELLAEVGEMNDRDVPGGGRAADPSVSACSPALRGVYSPDSEKGVSYSIRTGLSAAPDSEYYAFFVADQPYLTRETAEAFLETMEREASPLGCVCCGGESGNPVWFSGDFRSELMELTGDRGGKRILRAHWEQVRLFEVENPLELRDLDVPEAIVSAGAELKI